MFKIRILASIIDLFFLIAVTYILSFSNVENYNAKLSINFLMAFVYFSIFNSKIFKGKTIGKAICKISVKSQFFGNLSFTKSCLRSFVLLIPFYILFFDIEFENLAKNQYENILSLKTYLSVPLLSVLILLSIFDNPLHRGLHDILSQSVVIKNNYSFLAFPYQSKIFLFAFIGSVFLTIITVFFNLSSIESKYPSVETQENLSLLKIVQYYPNIVYLNFDKQENKIILKINVPFDEFENNLSKILKEWRLVEQSSVDLKNCKINLLYIKKENLQINDYIKYTRTDEINSKIIPCSLY